MSLSWFFVIFLTIQLGLWKKLSEIGNTILIFQRFPQSALQPHTGQKFLKVALVYKAVICQKDITIAKYCGSALPSHVIVSKVLLCLTPSPVRWPDNVFLTLYLHMSHRCSCCLLEEDLQQVCLCIYFTDHRTESQALGMLDKAVPLSYDLIPFHSEKSH